MSRVKYDEKKYIYTDGYKVYIDIQMDIYI